MSNRRPVQNIAIAWFRNDLRLADNPALSAAAQSGLPLLPLFIAADPKESTWPPGAASRWWLHHSLEALDKALQEKGLRLLLRQGPPQEVFADLCKTCSVQAVYWNHRYEPALRGQDAVLATWLRESGVEVYTCNGALLHEPDALKTKSGTPYRVFTPFWKAALKRSPAEAPLPLSQAWRPLSCWPKPIPLKALALLPRIDWASGLRAAWQPGELGAQQRLHAFLNDGLPDYRVERDRPDHDGVSRLSPHLHFGEISPRQIYYVLQEAALGGDEDAAEAFLRQLYWREFAWHMLWHAPHTTDTPLRPEFAAFPWQHNPQLLTAWQQGRTGFPYIDAGMRQLWHTGWMHNRPRMAVASFLIKDLLLPWQEGARWFWDTLVDADLANNSFGWQWTAGSGADAAPYFRIFNPVSQGKRFDPHGAYIRRWVPEVAQLPDKWLHAPWEAPAAALESAGVYTRHHYPQPLVDHAEARVRALDAFQRIKRG